MLPSISIVNPPQCKNSPSITAHCTVTAVADTGASSHYLRDEDKDHAVTIPSVTPGPEVTLPNAENVQATTTAIIPLSKQLSPEAQTGHVLPALKSSSLLSMGKFCDDGCDVVFRKNTMHLLKDPSAMDKFLKTQTSILDGQRNLKNNLWDITLANIKDAPHHSIVLPRSHAGLYPTRHANTPPQLTPIRQH